VGVEVTQRKIEKALKEQTGVELTARMIERPNEDLLVESKEQAAN